jgi:peroxiredoxin
MKFFLSIALIVLCTKALAADLSVGNPAPDIRAKLLDSAEVFQVSQKRRKVVIVNFWATWCAPCKAEMPTLQAYFDKHKSEGLEILAISMDEAKDVQAVKTIAQSYGFYVALKSDSNFKGLGRIWRMPTTFVIDKEGILRKNGHVGVAEITMTELESLVTPLLSK